MKSGQSERNIEADLETVSGSVSPFMAAIKCICPTYGGSPDGLGIKYYGWHTLSAMCLESVDNRATISV